MRTKIYIFRAFDTHVEKPQSYNIFSMKKIGGNTEYGFYVNKLPYSILLPPLRIDNEISYLRSGGNIIQYEIFYSSEKNRIERKYLKRVRDLHRDFKCLFKK